MGPKNYLTKFPHLTVKKMRALPRWSRGKTLAIRASQVRASTLLLFIRVSFLIFFKIRVEGLVSKTVMVSLIMGFPYSSSLNFSNKERQIEKFKVRVSVTNLT